MLKDMDQCKLKDGGTVEKAKFKQFLLRVFEVDYVDETVLDTAFKEATGNGTFEIECFLLWYKANMFSGLAHLTADPHKAQSSLLVDRLAEEFGVPTMEIDNIKVVFDKFDVDKSGSIEYPEFLKMMKQLLGVKEEDDLPQARAHRFWVELDADSSGEVDFSEFAAWYIKYFSAKSEASIIDAFYSSLTPTVQRRRSVQAEHVAASEEAALEAEATGWNRSRNTTSGLGRRHSTIS